MSSSERILADYLDEAATAFRTAREKLNRACRHTTHDDQDSTLAGLMCIAEGAVDVLNGMGDV